MPIVTTVRMIARTVERFFIYRVFSLDDTPHRIALGAAVGIFVAWTPTLGIQMFLTVALAWLLRANKFVGLPFCWVTNVLTIIPIYGPSLLLGRWLLGKDIGDFSALYKAMRVSGGLVERMQSWFKAINPIFLELWIGSIILGLAMSISTYFIILNMTIAYRRRRERKRTRTLLAGKTKVHQPESQDEEIHPGP